MKYSIILTFASSLLIYDSTCYGDACQINGLSQEELKNLSYDPPRNELLSEAQDKKAWQTFVETYEVPVGKYRIGIIPSGIKIPLMLQPMRSREMSCPFLKS